MDGAPVRGESIPVRLYLSTYDLTPTYRNINNKFRYEGKRANEREMVSVHSARSDFRNLSLASDTVQCEVLSQPRAC